VGSKWGYTEEISLLDTGALGNGDGVLKGGFFWISLGISSDLTLRLKPCVCSALDTVESFASFDRILGRGRAGTMGSFKLQSFL
jgi:hypothetical protein